MAETDRGAPARAIALATAATLAASPTHAEPATDDVVKSNNPLNPAIAFNVQDYYAPSLNGLPDAKGNVGIVRALTPFELGGYANLLRTQLQIPGLPTRDGGINSRIGDLTAFDIVIVQERPFAWGLGPLIVAPTATDDAHGAGRWQAGGAAGFAVPKSWGVFGTLTTYQHSVGYSRRPGVEVLTVQPFLFVNLPASFYLQSSGAWTFDLKNDQRFMPLGLGIGRHWQLSRLVSVNTFVEPQYIVSHRGAGTPEWDVFAGVSFQYSLADVLARRGQPR